MTELLVIIVRGYILKGVVACWMIDTVVQECWVATGIYQKFNTRTHTKNLLWQSCISRDIPTALQYIDTFYRQKRMSFLGNMNRCKLF